MAVLSHTGIVVRRWKTVAAVAVFALVYSFLYGLWLVPGLGFGFMRMAAVTALDVVYLAAASVLSGLLVVMVRQKMRGQKGLSGVAGVAAGVTATLCPVCQGVTLLALGSSVAFLPIGALSPFVWMAELVSLFLLWMAFYLTAKGLYTNECIGCAVMERGIGAIPGIGRQMRGTVSLPANEAKEAEPAKPTPEKSDMTDSPLFLAGLTVVVLLVIVNQFMLAGGATTGISISGAVVLKDGFEYGAKVTLKPMPLGVGEQPRIAGYRSMVKALPTISELDIRPGTGDTVQDLANNIIPHGTPWYGAEAGVSFDDPITAQNLWGRARGIQLTAAEQERWSRIVNSFTCDYCCGSPQQPTIITNCGCAHAQGAQGMAKWFIKNHGNEYSDEEIYGEMARWYALWYPGPTVQRIVQELSV